MEGGAALEVRKLGEFDSWLSGLKDPPARMRLARHFERIEAEGTVFGDVPPVGGGVSELRFHFGPGYRAYFKQYGNVLLLLALGGDKSSQEADIRRARELVRRWEESSDEGQQV